MTVDTFKLLDGTQIPWIAYGNGTGDAQRFFDQLGPTVLKHFDHIDTAEGYMDEKAEKATGDLLTAHKVPRAEMYLTSKLSHHNGWADPVKLKDIRSEIIKSIGFMQRKPNLFLIHSPYVIEDNKGSLDNIKAGWKIFEDLKDEGILESIGVSNFCLNHLEAVLEDCRYKPAVNQLEFHPYVLSSLEELLALQKKHGIVTESYGPLTPTLRNKEGRLTPILERIAKEHSKEAGRDVNAQDVLLLWTKAQGVVAVTTSGKEERIASIASVSQLPALTSEQVAEITKIGKQVHFRYYDEHMAELKKPDLPSK